MNWDWLHKFTNNRSENEWKENRMNEREAKSGSTQTLEDENRGEKFFILRSTPAREGDPRDPTLKSDLHALECPPDPLRLGIKFRCACIQIFTIFRSEWWNAVFQSKEPVKRVIWLPFSYPVRLEKPLVSCHTNKFPWSRLDVLKRRVLSFAGKSKCGHYGVLYHIECCIVYIGITIYNNTYKHYNVGDGKLTGQDFTIFRSCATMNVEVISND